MARELRVARHVYQDWEQDKAEPPHYRFGPTHERDLTEQETFMLLRKRSMKSVAELARLLGCTRYWLWKMETGRVNPWPLRLYWRSEGVGR